MRTNRADVLPASLPPLGINREQAAELIGVSVSTFDKLVVAGTMPRPRVITGRRLVYDVSELAEAFRRLPHQGLSGLDDEASSENPWDE